MDGLKFALVALCFWGNAVWATTADGSGGERQELQTISSWMAHLNFYYPSTEVQVSSMEDLNNSNFREETLEELGLLENVLRGEQTLPEGSLMHIACANVVCGGGDGGNCIKCSTGD